MIFADLAAGDSVFLDANTFIYHYGPDPALGSPLTRFPKAGCRFWTSPLRPFRARPPIASTQVCSSTTR